MVWNRTRERAERLVADLGGRVVDAPEPAVLIVNCTSVGLQRTDDCRSRACPSGPIRWASEATWWTWSTGPAAPALLAEARRRGATVVTGLEILVAQGAASFERWTGMTAPRGAMRAAVDETA